MQVAAGWLSAATLAEHILVNRHLVTQLVWYGSPTGERAQACVRRLSRARSANTAGASKTCSDELKNYRAHMRARTFKGQLRVRSDNKN